MYEFTHDIESCKTLQVWLNISITGADPPPNGRTLERASIANSRTNHLHPTSCSSMLARGLQLGAKPLALRSTPALLVSGQPQGRAFSLLSTLRAAASSGGAGAVSSSGQETDAPANYQLVIVGTGWAGYQMFTQCNKHLVDIEATVGRPVDIVVVSKRNVSTLQTPSTY